MPLTPLSFEILIALADEPRHGYGIIKEIEAREGAAAAPSTGALYLALQRMEREGLIGGAQPPVAETDPRRRYYCMTEAGRRLAVEESSRLAELVGAARSKKLLPEVAS